MEMIQINVRRIGTGHCRIVDNTDLLQVPAAFCKLGTPVSDQKPE
jgi:hypothetical protein